ncbi:MAG TPA: AmmeMemoRadiSam system radical SAM enzyme [Coriobacteriia bacterium]
MQSRVADLWVPDAGAVRCLLCPHACRIRPGATGICGVRRNEDGTLIALTWGRISSVAVDPIEKKPVFHYRPGSSVLSLGSVGCTMRCGHCQNWQISRATTEDGILFDLPPLQVVELALRDHCAGVAFTYNEPVIQAEYVRDCAGPAHDAGLFTVMVTNGYITQEGLDYLAGSVDVWRVDLKGMTDEAYRTLCRVPSVAPVLAATERAKHVHHMHVEVVTNVVPGINDDEAQLRSIAAWIAGSLGPETPWHITRFFPYLDFADKPPTPLETLRLARDIGLAAGLHFVYLGNVDEPGSEDTRCPGCGETLVRRSGFIVSENHIADGHCPGCGRRSDVVTAQSG